MAIKLFIAALAIASFVICGTAAGGLEVVGDDELVEQIKSDNFLIVLFAKPKCAACDVLETELFNLRNEFKEILKSNVVKVVNSQLVRLYSPTKEPAILFFRRGTLTPLLYDGSPNGDEIFQKFNENRMPAVKNLSDENFEHLTQASTGGTTGDWFVMFINRECIECQRLSAVWEAVGAATRNRLNVARIDKDTQGVQTAKRFKVQKVPEFILIRQGKFYRYEIPQFDIKSFVSFATEFYKNARAERIQVPPSPFDDVVAASVSFIKEVQANGINVLLNDVRFFAIFVSIALGLLIITILKCCYRRDRSGTGQKGTKNKAE